MKTAILKGVEKDMVAEIRAAFIAALPLRKQLIKILEDKIETWRKDAVGFERYNSPNWAYTQADMIGYERALRECISLLQEK